MKLGVTYIPEHMPNHIEDDLRQMADIGCSEVLFALQENTFNAVNGAVKYGARLAIKHGLTPHAVFWGFANTFGGGRQSDFLLKEQDAWRIDSEANKIPMACLQNPKVADEFGRLTSIARDHGFEGFFVDEPMRQDCFCPICREAFRGYSDSSMEDSMKEWTSWMKSNPQWYLQIPKRGEVPIYGVFQNDILGEYVGRMCDLIKGIHKSLKTVTCVFADDHGAWDSIVRIKSLDVFATDPYWLKSDGQMSIEHAVKRTVALKEISKAHGKESQVWLNCWSIPAGVEEEVYTGGKLLAEVGCDSFYSWSYKGGLGTTTEESDNVEKTWDNTTRLYREISGRKL